MSSQDPLTTVETVRDRSPSEKATQDIMSRYSFMWFSAEIRYRNISTDTTDELKSRAWMVKKIGHRRWHVIGKWHSGHRSVFSGYVRSSSKGLILRRQFIAPFYLSSMAWALKLRHLIATQVSITAVMPNHVKFAVWNLEQIVLHRSIWRAILQDNPLRISIGFPP